MRSLAGCRFAAAHGRRCERLAGMSEWWTYRPSDFLLFSSRTYWRLFELHYARSARPLLLVTAAAWGFVAWGLHLQRYAGINWASGWFAAAFAVQCVLLLALTHRPTPAACRSAHHLLARQAGTAARRTAAVPVRRPRLRASIGAGRSVRPGTRPDGDGHYRRVAAGATQAALVVTPCLGGATAVGRLEWHDALGDAGTLRSRPGRSAALLQPRWLPSEPLRRAPRGAPIGFAAQWRALQNAA